MSKEGGAEEHKILAMMALKLIQLVHKMELVLILKAVKLVLKLFVILLMIGVASQKLPAPMGNPIWMEGCVRASAIDQLVLLDLVWLVTMSWCLPGRCGARVSCPRDPTGWLGLDDTEERVRSCKVSRMWQLSSQVVQLVWQLSSQVVQPVACPVQG